MTEPAPAASSPVSLVFFPVSGDNFAVADPSVSGVTNQPIVQPVSGLVLFTPRLRKGTSFWIEDFLVTAAYNAEQTVNIIGNASQGTFTLQILGTWTTALPFDVAPSAMQAALLTAAGAATGDITVVLGPYPASYSVQFANNLGAQTIPIMNANPGTLEDALDQPCDVTVDGTVTGTPQVVADTAISIPPLQARIWDGVLSTIDEADTPGFQLLADMPELNVQGVAGTALIYDVTFDQVTYNGGPGVLAPWAFQAPPDATPVCLTSPDLARLPYQTPLGTTWAPPQPGLTAVGDWRTRETG
jgi:hypothetical protein